MIRPKSIFVAFGRHQRPIRISHTRPLDGNQMSFGHHYTIIVNGQPTTTEIGLVTVRHMVTKIFGCFRLLNI
jgi:hypothetical protein